MIILIKMNQQIKKEQKYTKKYNDFLTGKITLIKFKTIEVYKNKFLYKIKLN